MISNMRQFVSFLEWCNNHGERGKQLLSEWTGIRQDNRKVIKAGDMHAFSSIKPIWKCSNNHEWVCDTAHRTLRANGGNCPFCNKENSLYNWIKSDNSGLGDILNKEWTGIDINGIKYNMQDVTYGSNIKMNWQCNKCNHKWYATIKNRIIHRSGCPKCKSPHKTSYAEQFLYQCFKQIYSDTESRAVVLKSVKYPRGIEFDIGIPSIRTCIEYSPTYWHKDRAENDALKRKLCDKYGVRYIEIIDDSYKELEQIYSDNYICDSIGNNIHVLENIVRYILGDEAVNVNFDMARNDALNTSLNSSKYNSNSIFNKYYAHELYGELLYKDNISFESFAALGSSSHKEMNWKCIKCGHGTNGEWITAISSRTIDETGCPKCRFNIFKFTRKTKLKMQ